MEMYATAGKTCNLFPSRAWDSAFAAELANLI